MEIRLMSSPAERRLFECGLVQARASSGVGFREKARSRVGQLHLAFGRLYGVFDERSSEPDKIVGGFAIHALDEFAQSYPKPDLTRYNPSAVFEAGEMWSASRGVGLCSRLGCAMLLGLFQAEALVVYPISKPWDLTTYYKGLCKPVDEPILWPFAETTAGDKIWVQAMVMEGEMLKAIVSRAFEWGFQTLDKHNILRFANPLAMVQATLSVNRERGTREGAPLH
ncbi:MAG TPA: hypothetical protein VGI47_09460 [Candidatus Binataceae bacterium]